MNFLRKYLSWSIMLHDAPVADTRSKGLSYSSDESLCEKVWYAFFFKKVQIRKGFFKAKLYGKTNKNYQRDYNDNAASILAKYHD